MKLANIEKGGRKIYRGEKEFPVSFNCRVGKTYKKYLAPGEIYGPDGKPSGMIIEIKPPRNDKGVKKIPKNFFRLAGYKYGEVPFLDIVFP